MITLTLTRDPQLKIQKFQVTGHAPFTQNPNPQKTHLLCPAISMLVQTIILGIQQHLGQNILVQKSKGYVLCSIQTQQHPDTQEKIDLIINVMISGFEQIKKSFPHHISLETKIEPLCN